MPQITVVKPFTLTIAHGNQKRYEQGTYEVSDDVAQHWYTQAHVKSEDAKMPSSPVASFPHAGQTLPTLAVGIVPERPIVVDQNLAALSSQPANASLMNTTMSTEPKVPDTEQPEFVSLDPTAKPAEEQKPFSSDPAVKPKKGS